MMDDLQTPVTKGLLQAFGTKCKKMFRPSPTYIRSGVGGGIKIQTSLNYDDGFKNMYLNIQGNTYTRNTEIEENINKVLNSNFYYNKLGYFAQGVNLGNEQINLVVFAKENDKLTIYIILSSNRNISDVLVDLLAYKEESHIINVIEDVTAVQLEEEPDVYELIYSESTVSPFSKAPIGYIINQLQQETSFTIVEDLNNVENEEIISSSKIYPNDTVFNKIFESTLSNKLSHNLTFQYDWELPISSEDLPVNITNGKLEEGAVVKIPVPKILNDVTSEGLWAAKVQVENGIVTAVDLSSDITKASSTQIGGVLLMTDNHNSIGEKIPLQLDSVGLAFIDKNNFEQDKHRDDLTKEKYQSDENIQKYLNQIWQHIGETTSNFINGYFYKCLKTTFTIKYDGTDSPYSIGTLLGTKLENYIYNNGLALDLTKTFRLYVDTYPQAVTINQVEEDVKISDLNEFKLINTDEQGEPIGTPLVMTKAQLSEILDITIKTTDGWDTALTKDYPQSVMTLPFTLNSTSYAWKQWDVQPRTGIGSALEFITNDEIDYLFNVHVSSLSINDDELELSVGDTYTLEVTVSPADADNQMVTWSSSDPSAISVVKISPTEAEVTVGSDAVVGEDYIITCTSVDSERTITCTITIVS